MLYSLVDVTDEAFAIAEGDPVAAIDAFGDLARNPPAKTPTLVDYRGSPYLRSPHGPVTPSARLFREGVMPETGVRFRYSGMLATGARSDIDRIFVAVGGEVPDEMRWWFVLKPNLACGYQFVSGFGYTANPVVRNASVVAPYGPHQFVLRAEGRFWLARPMPTTATVRGTVVEYSPTLVAVPVDAPIRLKAPDSTQEYDMSANGTVTAIVRGSDSPYVAHGYYGGSHADGQAGLFYSSTVVGGIECELPDGRQAWCVTEFPAEANTYRYYVRDGDTDTDMRRVFPAQRIALVRWPMGGVAFGAGSFWADAPTDMPSVRGSEWPTDDAGNLYRWDNTSSRLVVRQPTELVDLPGVMVYHAAGYPYVVLRWLNLPDTRAVVAPRSPDEPPILAALRHMLGEARTYNGTPVIALAADIREALMASAVATNTTVDLLCALATRDDDSKPITVGEISVCGRYVHLASWGEAPTVQACCDAEWSDEKYLYPVALSPRVITCACCNEPVMVPLHLNTRYHHAGETRAWVAICAACVANEPLATCPVCETFHHGDTNSLCGVCAEDHSRCTNCDAWTSNDEVDEEGQCPSCHGAADTDDSDDLLPYGYAPKQFLFRGAGPLYFGCEIELECKNRDVAARAKRITDRSDLHIYAKHDGSLNCGAEFVTHPFSWQWFLDNIDSFRDLLEEARHEGFRATKTCGLHVHCTREAFTTVHEYRLYKLIYNNPRAWEKTSSRLITEYCDFTPDFITPRDLVSVARKKSSFSGRRVAVNPTDSTIEWRMWAGTSYFDRFASALAMTACASDYARQESRNVRVGLTSFAAFASSWSRADLLAPRLAVLTAKD